MGKECTHELNYCACAFDDLMSRRAAVDGEAVAELCHEQWSNWMRYLFSKCEYDEETGQMIIPCWAVERWKNQAATPYKKLTIAEQDSDRREADKFIELMGLKRKEPEWRP